MPVPVIANGNIRTMADVDQCMEQTNADAVMSAYGLLANPALFANPAVEMDEIQKCQVNHPTQHLAASPLIALILIASITLCARNI